MKRFYIYECLYVAFSFFVITVCGLFVYFVVTSVNRANDRELKGLYQQVENMRYLLNTSKSIDKNGFKEVYEDETVFYHTH